MATLVIAEHNNSQTQASTFTTIAAAKQLSGETTVLVVGKDCQSVADKIAKAEGVDKKLVGFIVEDRRVPRHGYLLEDKSENGIGVVTSGTQSPSLSIPIGMGYVKTEFAKVGTEILVVAGKKKLNAKIVKLPFYKKD